MDLGKLIVKSQEAVAAAQELARRRGNPEIYPEHLLLALLDHLCFALDAAPRDQVLAWIKKVRGGRRVTSQDPEGSYQALEKFGRDLSRTSRSSASW